MRPSTGPSKGASNRASPDPGLLAAYGRRQLIGEAEDAVDRREGTLKSIDGVHNRDTVLIAGNGTIVAAYEKVGAEGRAARVLEDARRLRAEARV